MNGLSAVLAEYKQGKVDIEYVHGYTDFLVEENHLAKSEQETLLKKLKEDKEKEK